MFFYYFAPIVVVSRFFSKCSFDYLYLVATLVFATIVVGFRHIQHIDVSRETSIFELKSDSNVSRETSQK